MKLQLASGVLYGYGNNGERICTGSAMGRRDVLPASTHPKLRLQRLPFMDGCYDRWSAYWGGPANVWCAWDYEGTLIFRRGDSRDEVKAKIKTEWPCAAFYR